MATFAALQDLATGVPFTPAPIKENWALIREFLANSVPDTDNLGEPVVFVPVLTGSADRFTSLAGPIDRTWTLRKIQVPGRITRFIVYVEEIFGETISFELIYEDPLPNAVATIPFVVAAYGGCREVTGLTQDCVPGAGHDLYVKVTSTAGPAQAFNVAFVVWYREKLQAP